MSFSVFDMAAFEERCRDKLLFCCAGDVTLDGAAFLLTTSPERIDFTQYFTDAGPLG